MDRKPVTLSDICDPFFQYICRQNRAAQRGVNVDGGQVRSELKSMLADLRMQAESAGLGEQFAQVRLPLVGFADFMMRESRHGFARNWRSLAEEEKQLGLDQRFFEMLDETLADPSEKAAERLAIFHTCIGLGFTGMYMGQPDVLRRKQLEVTARIRSRFDTDSAARITAEAYEQTDKRVLQQPVAQGVVTWVIVLVVLTAGAIVANISLYRSAASTLKDALERVAGQVGSDGRAEGK
ncbi:MAG: hypothetical protein AMXMBFR58_14220 [Phycisphaerae bacterium]|nr:hypothetical protein [Phycisphaerales bacterium]MCK6475738.1 DotU family type IV/VI secretion system protein [Phycisphaerales bacterium]